MHQAIDATHPGEWQRFCELPCPSALSPAVIARHRPDALWLLTDGAEVVARCSLWWKETPTLPGQRLGLIGHYAARNGQAAAQLLNLACDHLLRQGCTLAIGPMDGNTWRRYRLLTERGPEPIFFMEPDNPDDWPGHFTSNGFTPLARYHSALNTDLAVDDPRVAETGQRLEECGITLRRLDPARFEEELRGIFAVSVASFCENFLYTPITEEDFLTQYRGIELYVRPELVLVAEQKEQPIGFIFTIPDLLQAKRGQAIDTAIVKSMAVHPDHAGVGLGGLLMARSQQAARELGYSRVIHALMHETNRSGKISKHTARVIRTYSLFVRELTK